MKKCSLCGKDKAIAKIKWIGENADKTPFYPCINCYVRITTEMIKSFNKKLDEKD